MIGHKSPISGIAASGTFVATVGYDNRVVLWDAQKRTAIDAASHDHLANQCAFSADGQTLATASSDYTARLWSVPAMRLLSVFNDHEDDVEMVAFHPTGDRVATACRDHRARVFDFDGRLLARFNGHTADVISVAWSREGDALITAGDDATVRWWDVSSGHQICCVDMSGAETDTITLLDDNAVIAGNDRGELVLITREQTVVTPAHAAGVKRVQYDSRSKLVVSTSYDRTVNLWRRAGDELHLADKTIAPPPIWLRALAFGANGTLLFSTFGGGYASYNISSGLWDLDLYRASGGFNAVLVHDATVYTIGDAGELRGDGRHEGSVGSFCNFLTHHRGRILTGGQLGMLFDARTGEVIHRHHSPLNCAAVSKSDESVLFVGTYTGEVLSFDSELRFMAAERLHTNAVKGLALAGNRLFSVCATGDVAVHDAVSMRCIRHVAHAHSKIANAACTVKGIGFASASRDLTLRLWSLSGDAAGVLPTPHRHSVKCVASDPDGRRIATGAYDGTIAVLDVQAQSWTCMRPTTAGISSLAFDDEKMRSSRHPMMATSS